MCRPNLFSGPHMATPVEKSEGAPGFIKPGAAEVLDLTSPEVLDLMYCVASAVPRVVFLTTFWSETAGHITENRKDETCKGLS